MLYVSIAEKYLSGNFRDAINGYWGPLLSWLLIPSLYFNVSDVMAINIIDLVAGNLTLIGIWLLSYKFKIEEWLRSMLILISLPVVIKFSLVQPMDLLLVSVIVLYLVIIFKEDYPERISYGFISGVLGALAYFSKAYGLPFFVAHFFSMNLFYFLKDKTKSNRIKILRNALAGFIIFFILSGIWIGLISSKYGHFTFSTMRKTNFNAPGPEGMNKGLEFNVPVFYEGFFSPPNETAFVIWEDPSYLKGNKWTPWQSWVYFKHFLKLLFKNTIECIEIYERFSFFSITIIIFIILILVKTKELSYDKIVLLSTLFTIFLYTGGYLLFHIEERYLWIVNILLLIMGGHVVTYLIQSFFAGKIERLFLITIFAVSFIIMPFKYIVQAGGTGNIDRNMYELSKELKKYNIKGNIASNRMHIPVHDAWHNTFRLAYWLDSKYFGQARENITDNELEKELQKYGIDYYFVWNGSDHIPEFLTHFKEITGGEIPELKIYSLKAGKKQ
jgi:hypothetical protein